jgi:hypothetical protein
MHYQDTTTTTSVETTPITMRKLWYTALVPWGRASLAVLPTFMGTRLLLLILTCFGGVLFSVQNNSSFALTWNSVLYNSWYHWDAQRNITIASQGYIDPSYTTLFPLYPTLVHLCSSLLKIDILLIGMLLTNVTFFAALVVLYLLILTESSAPAEETKRLARRSVLYLALFPTALFFFAAYNTSLILFLALFCLYLLRRSHWWLAGCVGGLAALADITGIILFAIFLCEYGRQHSNLFFRRKPPSKDNAENEMSIQQRITQYLPLLASLFIPLGLGVYAYGLYKPFHNFAVFLYPQLWSDTPLPGAWSTASHALTSGSLFTYAALHTLFELLITLSMFVLLVLALYGPLALAKCQWPLVLFGGLVMVWGLLYAHQPGAFPSQYDPFPATQYAALLCFPAFLVLARLGERSWVHTAYLVGSTALLIFLIFQMFTGHWSI